MLKYQKLIPIGLFSLFFLKCLILPFSYPEVGFMAILGALVAYLEYKSNESQMKVLEDKLNTAVRGFEDKIKQIDDIKGQVSGLKLSAIARSSVR